MQKLEILTGLIAYLDMLYKPKRWWLEFASDRLFEMVIMKGYEYLENSYPALAKEFLEAGEEFLVANMAGLVDEVADLGAELFKLLVFKKSTRSKAIKK